MRFLEHLYCPRELHVQQTMASGQRLQIHSNLQTCRSYNSTSKLQTGSEGHAEQISVK